MYKSEDEVLRELKIEDLEELHAEIAEEIGIDGLLKLVKRFAGNPIYIPQKSHLVKGKIYKDIYNDYNGSNIKELTVKYGVCETTVYNIVRDKLATAKIKRQEEKRMIPGQLSIEDWDYSSE